MITKLDIQEKDGFLIMEDFPANCIFNKVKTGCGATTIALTNSENYIIAVPTTELVENKCYPTKDADGNVRFWKKNERKPGVSPVVNNLFGLYGNFTRELRRKLKDYLSSDGVKKIICTYDKIDKLVEFINPMDFKLTVDEYHNFLKQYSFRDKAINGVLEHFKKFKSYCFLSATPIPEDLKPAIFEGIPEYMANWKTVDKITVCPYHTDKPYMIVAKLIRAYRDKGIVRLNGIESDEAYFFVNSVREIKRILDQAQLKEDDYRIICADNDKNRANLKGYSISSSTDEPKKFNFITSKSFEGVDFHSEKGLCFVVSNVKNKHTLVSVDMDIPQIAGRIRTKSNPLRNMIVHIFNTKATSYFITYEEMKQSVECEKRAAQERADLFNNSHLSEKAIKQEIEQIKKIGKESYLSYIDGQFVVNDMIGKLQLYSFLVDHEIYQSAESLKAAYAQHGITTTKTKWCVAPKEFISQLIKPRNFRKSLQRFCEIMEQESSTQSECAEIAEIIYDYPFLEEAREKLGIPTIRRLRSIKGIKAKLKEVG